MLSTMPEVDAEVAKKPNNQKAKEEAGEGEAGEEVPVKSMKRDRQRD